MQRYRHRRAVFAVALIALSALVFQSCPNPSGPEKPVMAATPAFSPPAGTYGADQAVAITSATDDATIHYTTDGTTPTTDSPVYDVPIEVTGHGTTMTISAMAVHTGLSDSDVASASYEIDYIPAMPADLVATPTTAGVAVSWTAAPSAYSYRVQHSSTGPDSGFEDVYTGAATSCVVDAVPGASTYWYRVRSENGDYYSDWTEPDTADPFPETPASLAASEITANSATLSWSAAALASEYRLDRSPDAVEEWTQIYEGALLQYTDPALSPAESYLYRVSAVGTTGESGFSVACPVLTLPEAPAPPSADYVAEGEVELSWTIVSGADSYSLGRAESESGPWTEIYEGAGTTHTDSDLDVGQSYYYRVGAANASGANWSGSISVYTYPGPVPPQSVYIAGTTAVSLTVAWSPVSGGPTYAVYRSDYSSGGYAAIATDLATTTYTDEGLEEGETYYYRVTSTNEVGESALSDFTAGTTSISGRLGYFKVANSWGEGYWENVADGFYRITYDAMKLNSVYAFIYENRVDYEPEYLAVIEVEHPQRANCLLYVGVGNPGSPIDEKAVNDYSYGSGGTLPFPDNAIAIDVTEFAEHIGTEDLFLRVEDVAGDGASGTVELFVLEYHSDYSFDVPDPDAILASADAPVAIPDGGTVSLTIPTTGLGGAAATHDVAVSSGIATLARARPFTAGELQELRSTIGVAVPGENYNPIINGFGTGLRPPTEEEWALIAEHGLTLEPALQPAEPGLDQATPTMIDWSATEHFPPIGNQGAEGSCVSYSTAYYVKTFQEAYENGSDVASALWISGGPSDHQDEIYSPDFVYHQLNDGAGNVGTSYVANMQVLTSAGCATWSEMASSAGDSTTWPSESAWRQAPLARGEMITSSWQWGATYMIIVETDEEIDILRALLASGYLISISIDANQYDNLTIEDIWNTENYTNPDTNHANTIVGYEDVGSY
jgi:fibronectin type 3 domain-containing protein